MINRVVVNRMAIAQRMWETRAYVNPSDSNREDVWFLSYLKKEKKMTKEQAMQIWQPIFCTKHSSVEDETSAKLKWESACKISLKRDSNKFKTIVIYQSDIDYINSLKLRLGEKEILLMMIALQRQLDKNKFSVGWVRSVRQFMTANTTHENSAQLEQNLINANAVELIKTYKFDPIFGEDDIDISGEKFNFPPCSGDVILKTNVVYDIVYAFDMLKVKTCSKCGKEYYAETKCKTDMCPECYKMFRNKIRADDMRSTTNYIGSTTRVCEKCGKEFSCSGHCRRRLCNDCYKIYRKRYKSDNKRKNRTNVDR